MDIFSWLRLDHAEILGLFGEGADEGAWLRGMERWEIHARIEENFLFPLLKSESDLRHPLARAVQAHESIRECMRGLSPGGRHASACAGGDPGLLEVLKRLQGMKESRIFPRARESLAPDDAEELVSEVLDFLYGLGNALSAGR